MSKLTVTAGNAMRKPLKMLCSTTMAVVAAGLVSLLPAAGPAVFHDGQAYAQREQRPPPSTRSAQTLSQTVFRRVETILERMDEEDYDGALEELGDLRQQYERGRLNSFEAFTMLQFYANIAQTRENFPEALGYYEQMVQLPDVTADRLQQIWYNMGSLYFVVEEFENAIDALTTYLEISEQLALEPDDGAYIRIGSAYFQLERYEEAIPWILRNMEVLRAKGEQVPQNTYGLLRAIYFTLEDYQRARQVLREMVVLYNNPDDWGYLAAVQGQLEDYTAQGFTYWVANIMGYLDSSSQMRNLAATLNNADNPYGAGKVLAKAIEDGIVEDSAENLSLLSQFWQIAREDALAVEPLKKAAEMDNDADFYARLALVYMTLSQFEDAVDAYNKALDAENLDNPGQLAIQLARAYSMMDRYDEAIAAAREALSDERNREAARDMVRYLQNEKERYETLQRQRREYDGYFTNQVTGRR